MSMENSKDGIIKRNEGIHGREEGKREIIQQSNWILEGGYGKEDTN